MLDRSPRFAQTSHARIAYIDQFGDGLPVIFIHGNSVSKEEFSHQFAVLDQGYRKIALDLPGHGDSSDAVDPRRTYSIRGYANCIREFLGALNISECVVLGHSLGGMIGTELTGGSAGVKALITTGAPPFARSEEALWAAYGRDPRGRLSAQPDLTDEEVSVFCEAVLDAAGATEFWRSRVRRTDPRAREGLGRTLIAEDASDLLQLAMQFAGPIAVIDGAADAIIDPQVADAVRYPRLWQGRVLRIEGQGHAPHLGAPDQFNRLVGQFLAELRAERAAQQSS